MIDGYRRHLPVTQPEAKNEITILLPDRESPRGDYVGPGVIEIVTTIPTDAVINRPFQLFLPLWLPTR